jgi:hypothetical protein
MRPIALICSKTGRNLRIQRTPRELVIAEGRHSQELFISIAILKLPHGKRRTWQGHLTRSPSQMGRSH